MACSVIRELYRPLILVAVLILATACQTDQMATSPKVTKAPVADVWQGFPEKIKAGLTGVGLATAADYTKHGGAVIYNGNKDEDLEVVLNDKWTHLTFYVALDPYFIPNDYRLEDLEIIRPKFENLREQILKMSKEFPDKVFVISTKAREYVNGGTGEKQTYVYRAFEDSEKVRQDYTNMWKFIAEIMSDIPSDTLVFSIMNEPEFQNAWSGKSKWAKYATEIISAIRTVTPDRVALFEGTRKSVVGRRGAEDMSEVLPLDRIVYGFHFNDPYDLTHPKVPLFAAWEKSTNPCGYECDSLIKTAMDSIDDFSKDNGVPAMLSEFGAYGPYYNDTGEWIAGWTTEYRADWANKIYELTVPRGIGATWYALHDYSTPFKRGLGQVKMQKGFEKDEDLWKALRL